MRRLAGLLCCIVVAAACGAPMRGDRATRYQGMLLDARELGAGEVERAAAADPAVRDWIGREGQPDFVLVASPQDFQLVYYQASKIVLFHRPAPEAPSEVGVAEPLPSGIRPLLPADVRAGTGEPPAGPAVGCWTVDVPSERCRTCCQTAMACTIACRPR